MIQRKNVSKYAFIALPWLALLMFMLLTHPANLPVYALLVPFVLFGFAVYITLRAVTGRVMGRDSKHRKIITILLTVFLVVCAGLQSVGQLTIRDFMTVLLLTLLGYFYVYRNIIGTKQ